MRVNLLVLCFWTWPRPLTLLILCSKLMYYGFQGASYDLLCDYLTGRQQRVLFNGDLSQWGNVTIGVPQGSILGPLLFALYLNDLPVIVKHCILNLYADDAERTAVTLI